jgi:hypothetical protein
MVLGTKLRTVHLFLKYLTNLPNELKRRLKIAITALEIVCLLVCLKMYVKVKFSLSLKACLVDPIKTLNSVALVRERTIPTERPPPVGEVSANFCG